MDPLGSIDDHSTVCVDAGIEALLVHSTFAETAAEIVERCPGVKHLLKLGPSETGAGSVGHLLDMIILVLLGVATIVFIRWRIPLKSE